MSRFSGKCDLADHISMEKHRDKNGNEVKYGDPNVNVYYSDEMECFRIFKQKTGGVIYQHIPVEVTKYNLDYIMERCPELQKLDKGYVYWGTEYKTLRSLNNRGVYLTKEIHFDTLLDIIPYYPYIISSCCCTKDEEIIYISDRSYVDEHYEEMLKFGYDSPMFTNYKKELQEHYIDVVKRYYLPETSEYPLYLDF